MPPDEASTTSHAENLKSHVANAFGLPDHLRTAWSSWVDSVEARMGGGGTGDGSAAVVPSAMVDEAVEKYMDGHADSLKGPPGDRGEKGEPGAAPSRDEVEAIVREVLAEQSASGDPQGTADQANTTQGSQGDTQAGAQG